MNKIAVKLMNETQKAFGTNFEVRCAEVEQNDGSKATTVIIKENASDYAMRFGVDTSIELIRSKKTDTKTVVEKIHSFYMRYKDLTIKGTIENISRDFVLKNVVYKLINRKRNEKLLEQFPHRNILDLAAIYEINAVSSDGEMMRFCINGKTLEKLGITSQEIDKAAYKNTQQDRFLARNISEVLKLGIEMPMHVITSARALHGAAILFYADLMQKISDAYNDNLIIFPLNREDIVTMPELKQNKLG